MRNNKNIIVIRNYYYRKSFLGECFYMETYYKYGEELAIKYLKDKGYTVIDRREDSDYWKKDIDITAIKEQQSFNIEIKWDNKISKSRALFIELITDIQQNKQGWINYTEADYIFYGDSINHIFYVFSTGDMRKYLKEHKEDYQTRIATDYYKDTAIIRKQSLGAVVPLESLRHAIRIQQISLAHA